MQPKINNAVRLGLFIFVSLLLFIGAIYILGKKQGLFQQTIKISSVFKNVRGLKVGNNVRFTGIEVGTVVNISILSDTSVSVTFSIDRNVTPYIKKDSRATIGTEGLMGSTVVVILPGTPGMGPVEPGDEVPSIESVEIDDIVKEIKKSSEKISEVADNLISITQKINNGDGIFGKLFTDSELTYEILSTGKNVQRLSQNMNEIAAKLNRSEGILGKMLSDTTLASTINATVDNLHRTSESINDFSAKLSRGEGLVGNLFADTSITVDFVKLSNDLESVINNLSEVSEKINNENNALHKFIDDETFADSVNFTLQNLNRGIIEITEAAEALQRSGLVRAFSKDEEKLLKKEQKKLEKEAARNKP